MRVLHCSHTIAVSAEHVFDWFKNLDENYLKWHPNTHKNFQWLSEKPIKEGSIFSFEEELDEISHKMVMNISEYVENQRLSFSSIHIYSKSKYFPHWLITLFISVCCVKMEMIRSFEEVNKNLTTIQTIHKFGSPLPIIGKIIDWIAEHFILSSKNHLEHIEEEALNMKTYLENQF